ncbi:hypothetical protein BSKO_10026 [Bryopsis sp. KO-2023]|nr:hypothetical protein BSKO_10026 [Bryopsis sp. KO-2023]
MTPNYPRQYWRGGGGVQTPHLSPDGGPTERGGDRADQRSERRCHEYRERPGGRLRNEYPNKKPRWRRRTQQHPFVAGGNFSVRRNRPRKFNQRQQRGGGGGSRASGLSRSMGRSSTCGTQVSTNSFAPHSNSGNDGFQGFDARSETGMNERLESSRRIGTLPRDVSATFSSQRQANGDADSLMYSLEGRCCPPAPRHEPQYLREAEWPFRDWRGSPSVRAGSLGLPRNHPGKGCPMPQSDRKLESVNFNAPPSPSVELSPSIMQAMQCRASIISHFQEENGVLRAKLQELEAKLAATSSYPHSPSVADNSPVRENPCSYEKSEF